ncbi:hypothetical protein PAAG_01663 [Paracoccidioides lutzii Pb01]|uniref:Uncharacterized protein n=1 Tax=Paracoccidioides lutzii (strain ATCC MYA-826 / Pb01) TaxID=502779 RepID=C1GT18_PARBA|nr:hypothetical protein PAAG_01663 [Paracoccidioides lutzii Pb01]EEH39201.1 hypothetical protein PAAG_01663 [Paracoccidioides lutzii Pb01]
MQHRREIAEAQALEEQQLREEKQTQHQKARALTDLTNFLTFLLNCHTLSLAINVVTDPTLTTQEGTLDYIRKTVNLITAEMDLHYYECDSVENQVQMIVDSIYAKDILRQEFRLSGSVTFDSSFELESYQAVPTSGGNAEGIHRGKRRF